MRILLLGEVYSANLGDALICKIVQNLIQKQYPDYQTEFFDISGRVDLNVLHPNTIYEKLFVKIMQHIRVPKVKSPHYALFKNNEFRYLKVFLNFRKLDLLSYDVALFCGGALFQDHFAGIIELIVKQLSKAGVPTIFHACGMGPLSQNGEYLLNKAFCYSNVKAISLRDSIERFRQSFIASVEPVETYDTALCCREFIQPCPSQSDIIGVGIISRAEHMKLQENVIKQLLHYKIPFRVFTNGAQHDYQAAVRVLRECGCGDLKISQLLTRRPQTPEDLIQDISTFSKVISFRMHSLIIATAYAIDNRGFVWDEKVRSFYNGLGLSAFAIDPFGAVDIVQHIKCENIDYTTVEEKVSIATHKSKKDLFNAIERATRGVKNDS